MDRTMLFSKAASQILSSQSGTRPTLDNLLLREKSMAFDLFFWYGTMLITLVLFK